jgi:hypothetical protein
MCARFTGHVLPEVGVLPVKAVFSGIMEGVGKRRSPERRFENFRELLGCGGLYLSQDHFLKSGLKGLWPLTPFLDTTNANPWMQAESQTRSLSLT